MDISEIWAKTTCQDLNDINSPLHGMQFYDVGIATKNVPFSLPNYSFVAWSRVKWAIILPPFNLGDEINETSRYTTTTCCLYTKPTMSTYDFLSQYAYIVIGVRASLFISPNANSKVA